MNKNTAIGSLLAILVVCITVLCINFCEKENSSNSKIVMPKANEKMWTYDMTKKNWHKYKPLDEDNLKEYVILQFDDMTSDGGYCAYHLQTTNVQVPKELFVVGESSQEFLKNGHLYSYFPKNFEFYEIKFNGVKFIPQKMTSKDIQKLIPDINIIKVSALKK